MCGAPAKMRCSSRMLSADGSARNFRSRAVSAAAVPRVNPKGTRRGRCQAAMNARAAMASAAGIAIRTGRLAYLRGLRISRAAFWPGPPVMPPPGCVPAPQRYRPAIGVRYCAQPENRAHGEELIERRFAVQDVAARQPIRPLEIDGRDHLPVLHERFDAWRVDDRACASRSRPAISRCCPVLSVRQLVGRELHIDRHHVLPGGASDGSFSVGTAMSRYGSAEISPYFDASNARSR